MNKDNVSEIMLFGVCASFSEIDNKEDSQYLPKERVVHFPFRISETNPSCEGMRYIDKEMMEEHPGHMVSYYLKQINGITVVLNIEPQNIKEPLVKPSLVEYYMEVSLSSLDILSIKEAFIEHTKTWAPSIPFINGISLYKCKPVTDEEDKVVRFNDIELVCVRKLEPVLLADYEEDGLTITFDEKGYN